MAGGPIVIADAGPLIALSRIEQLDLLKRLFGRVLVTEEVQPEVLPAADYPGKAAIVLAMDRGWLELSSPAAANWRPLNPGIDAGESSAIAAALQLPGSLLIIDDRAGRAEAKAHGVQIIGTAGLIGLAKLRGLVPGARPLLEALTPAGYFLHPSVIATVLTDLGERVDEREADRPSDED